jgi:hypothetical protein
MGLIGSTGIKDVRRNLISRRIGELQSMQGKSPFNNLDVQGVKKPGNCLSSR